MLNFDVFFKYSNWFVLGKLGALLAKSHSVIFKDNQKKTWIYSMLEETLRIKSSNIRIIPSSRCLAKIWIVVLISAKFFSVGKML